MPSIEHIRKLFSQGKSITDIAKETGHDRKTVRKYLDATDFSPRCPAATSRPSILDPHKPFIDEILEQDRKVWRKQRHTARRIFERLREERGYEGGLTLVQNYVAERKRLMAQPDDCFLDLKWAPGSAQIDFCDVDVIVRGSVMRMFLFTLSFPFSNTGFCQLFAGVTAECICQGLINIFLFLGCVPALIVIDNATGAVKRICKRVLECDLYRSLRLHYGFESRACNPDAGHEKGNVERKGAYFRKHLFVPRPRVDDIEAFNCQLLKRSAALNCGRHYRKDQSVQELLERDKQACLALNETPFCACRWEPYKTDKYGEVTVEGVHTYDVDPACPLTDIWVGFGAYDVRFVHRATAEVLAVHPRQFGGATTHTSDPLKQLGVLQRKPGGYGQSAVRATLPKSLRSHLDALGKTELRSELKALWRAASTEGYKAAVEAREELLGQGIAPTANDLTIFARRIRAQLPAPEVSVDLSIYDQALLPQPEKED
nr:IS21 family transposase [uncultured Dysosmobacter sp.]